ncbi:hypothetical protein BDZ94DRAFT_762216 [Collybia nuda]|uniref:Uncharacterized protein n=1 Tax=Collybia nuda TaxID=64659 RepID=A0A9P5Y5L0_9AGAR|nr:hypothetical protein BDZ94DRAFT_762216 [Collybia nuda]
MGFVDVSPPTAGLIGSLAASLMYGLNIVAFFTCMYVLLRRRAGGNGVPWFIFCAAVVQFIVSTIHIGNCWRQMLEAFIWDAGSPGASFVYFVEEPAKFTEVINKALVFVESFLTDSILVWRAYIVWGRNIYICVAPVSRTLPTPFNFLAFS